MENQTAADILSFQIRKDVTQLYKKFLNVLEDIRIDNPNMIDDTKFNHLRKRILDFGNDTIRGLEEQLYQFVVDFRGAQKE